MQRDRARRGGGKALAAGTEDAGGMGFVDQQHGVVALGNGGQVGERGGVAVHAVEAFHRDPGRAGIAGRAPVADRDLDGGGIVVRDLDRGRAREAQSFAGAGVDQRVVNDHVAGLGQGGEQRDVGGIAAGKEQAGFRTQKGGGLRLQRLVFGVVAVEQARAARADGNAARDGIGDGGGKPRAGGEAEIVVGGEIDRQAGLERAQPVARGQRGEVLLMKGEHGGRLIASRAVAESTLPGVGADGVKSMRSPFSRVPGDTAPRAALSRYKLSLRSCGATRSLLDTNGLGAAWG